MGQTKWTMKISTWLSQQTKPVKWGLAGLLSMTLLLGVVSGVLANTPCEIKVDGQVVAVAANKRMAEVVVNQLTEQQRQQLNQVTLVQKVSFERTTDRPVQVLPEAKLRQILAEKLTFETTAVGIQVAGEVKVVVADKQTATQVLDKLKQTYQVDPDYRVSFQENVALVDLPVLSDKVLTGDAALKKLLGQGEGPRLYTVKEGDTLWDIAIAFDVSPEEVEKANPGFTPETMQIGQKIKVLGALEPMISVVATTEKTVTEDYEAPQQVKKNPNLPYGTSRVIQAGEQGRKEVTYQIVAVNGLENERKVLQKKILKEAKPQIIERSSQVMVASRGISRPAGAISSAYGSRWGRQHQGIDIARSYGTAIEAAGAGKVIRAGWFGGYGLCVEINHGNGVVTRYAHMSSVGVKVGQTVQRGQFIGKVGSTGRSTGPHLHFEKLVNGVPKNPTV